MPPASKLDTLVVVPGHAVFTGSKRSHACRRDSWSGPFASPRGYSEAPLYYEHVRQGVLVAARHSRALLVFSGGITRRGAEALSEAEGLWRLAEVCGWFGQLEVRSRATNEHYALDSFQNLHFAMCRFREVVGRLPSGLVVVGFAFKGPRYQDHFRAIMLRRTRLRLRGLKARFTYLGVNDPPERVLRSGSLAGERETRALFKKCPLGNRGLLARKRRERDILGRGNPY